MTLGKIMTKPFLCVLFFALLMFSCGTKDKTVEQNSPPPRKPAPAETAPAATKTVEEHHHEQSAPAETAPNNTAQDFEMPPFREDPDAAPLTATLDPAAVPPAAQQGYIVAQQKPKLLAQMPCFCYCNRFGHTSLHDCFTTNHAQECDICLKEAIEADQMDHMGLSPQEIRAVIVSKYHPKHSS
jgi:hypothetical protein